MVGGLATGPFHKHHVCQPHRHDNAAQAIASSLCKSWRTNPMVVLTVGDDPPVRPPLPRARRVLMFTPILSDCPLSLNESAESPGEEEQGSMGLPKSSAFVWGSEAPPLAPPKSLRPTPEPPSKRTQSLGAVENVRPLAGPGPFQPRSNPFCFCTLSKTLT